jgi:hypothetical protein
MRRSLGAARAAVLALVAPLPLLVATPAHAAVYNPGPGRCGAVFAESPTQAGYVVIELDGAVPVLDEEHTAAAHTGRLTCWVYSALAQAPLFVASGGTAPGVAALPPATATVPIDWAHDYITICTRVEVDGGAGAGGTTFEWDTWDSPAGWSTSPARACEPAVEAGTDEPVSLWDPVNAAVCPVLGTVPVLGTDLQTVWEDCETTPLRGLAAIQRTPAGVVAATLPFGWACTDVRTGAPVVAGGLLTAPDPGVSCTPGAIAYPSCGQLRAGGRQSGTGPLTVTTGCGVASITRSVYADGPGVPQPVGVRGVLPWRCTVDEPAVAPADYTVFCAVNGDADA